MNLESKIKKALVSNDINALNSVFEEVYNQYYKLIYFLIFSYTRNNNDTEELTQDVFLSFFNSLNKRYISNIKYYLVVSAKNVSINYLKKKQKNTFIEFNDDYIFKQEDNIIKYNELYCDLYTILNDFEVMIIIYHLVYDLTFKELSEMYNKPLNTIISIYRRGIIKFKKGNKNNEDKK